MKTDRSTIFAGFALMLLMILIVNLGALDLSPILGSTPISTTGTLPSNAVAAQVSTPTLSPIITPTHQTLFIFNRDNFPSCFTSRGYEGMRAYSLANKLHLVISSASYDYQICDEQVFSDFIYETDATLVDTAPADAEFGLITRYNIRDDENAQYYELTVWNGSASLYYLDTSADNPWMKLLDAVPVPVFNSSGPNHVKLIATGDILAVFINDIFIGQTGAPELASGHVGISLSNYGSASSEQHVVYENMQVYDLSWSAIVYEDSEFASGGCFGEESGDWFETSAQGGQYRIDLAADNSLMVPCTGPDLDLLTDFILEADVTQKTTGASGLAFRTNADTDAMYAFLMDPDGYVSLSFYPDSVDDPLILTDLASSAGISPLDEINHLKVISVGNTILVYVNGNLVFQMQGEGATNGGIALIAQATEADFQTIFDNVKITSLAVP